MLRNAIVYSNDNTTATAPQKLKVHRTVSSSTYESHYNYLTDTLACMVLQTLIIASLLSEWRSHGRNMSLDAFEVARALGTLLLQGGSLNSDIQETLSPLRRHRLRYGEIFCQTSEIRLDNRKEKETSRQIVKDDDLHEVMRLVEPEAEDEIRPYNGEGPRLGIALEKHTRVVRPEVFYN